MCVASQGPAIGLKFHSICSLDRGAVNPKIFAEIEAVHPRALKYAFAVFSPGFTNPRIKSIKGNMHSSRLVEQAGQ